MSTQKEKQPKTQKKPQNKRLTREERLTQMEESKIAAIKRNPEHSVVVNAEMIETKNIAYNVNKIDAIVNFARKNMGIQKISFTQGQELVDDFREITTKVNMFIEKAHSMGIGFKDDLKAYQYKLQKNKEFEDYILEEEVDSETKEREAAQKTVEKADNALNKALEAVKEAKTAKLEAETALTDKMNEISFAIKTRKEVQRDKSLKGQVAADITKKSKSF